MKTLKLLLTTVLLIGANMAFAAPAPPPAGGTTGTPACWPPPCVPIDNGIVFLMAAGALYGAKKLYDFRKTTQPLS